MVPFVIYLAQRRDMRQVSYGPSAASVTVSDPSRAPDGLKVTIGLALIGYANRSVSPAMISLDVGPPASKPLRIMSTGIHTKGPSVT